MASSQTERQFLNTYNIHDYDIPLVSVDIAIFSVIDDKLNVLTVKRAQQPRKGKWALPGGFINLDTDKTIEDAAYRKLAEKTGVTKAHLEQVISVGNNTRDPRGWSVTIAYMALVSVDAVDLRKDGSSEELTWTQVDQLKKNNDLAFDHNKILKICHQRLKDKVRYTSLPVNLLPPEFTLTELQRIFEVVLAEPIEKKSFRRRMLDAQILEETGNFREGSTRPAKLYRVADINTNYFFTRNIEGPR
ncbi:MAG: NUDIX hydrolase [Desulfofustis sp.]|nr:NUDIX hydrolase [Desulfofustis sp.]